MDNRSVDRMWLIGGVVGALAILGLAYILAIGPAWTNLTDTRDQSLASETDLAVQRTKLATLASQNGDIATYRTALAKAQLSLPSDDGTEAYVHDLTAAARSAKVTLSSVTVSPPTVVSGATPPAYAVPITVSTLGKPAETEKFLAEIQNNLPRAALVNTVSSASDGATTISLTVFVSGVPAAVPTK